MKSLSLKSLSRLLLRPALLGAGAVILAGCNQTGSRDAVIPPASAYRVPGVTPAGFQMPSGVGCAGDVARFQAIMDNDLEAGHTTQAVHDRVTVDLKTAGASCSAGRGAQASAMVRQTRAKYGYPPG